MKPNSPKWESCKTKDSIAQRAYDLTFEYRKYFYGVESNIDRKLGVENVNKIGEPNAFTRAYIFN